eukprot:scaffold18285_cov35-Tisochrysis_lutea.AAC.12
MQVNLLGNETTPQHYVRVLAVAMDAMGYDGQYGVLLGQHQTYNATHIHALHRLQRKLKNET